MAEAEGFPPTASTVVPGPSLNYAADWAYAFSGVGLANNSKNFEGLSFTSGNGIIKARIYCSIDNDDLAAGNQVGWRIDLNDIPVFTARVEATANDILDSRLTPYVDLIIPPFTKVFVLGVSDASNVEMSFLLSGRVYDV